MSPEHERPNIVVLCGSTRFREEFRRETARLTLEGNIVLSVGLFRGDPEWGANKPALDELHLRKIDLADEVFVIDVDGYVRKSTQAEINYARSKGKEIKYMNSLDKYKDFL